MLKDWWQHASVLIKSSWCYRMKPYRDASGVTHDEALLDMHQYCTFMKFPTLSTSRIGGMDRVHGSVGMDLNRNA